MALQSIQLCHIDPVDRARSQFEVTVHSDDQLQHATFSCSSEHDALLLRGAIRERADRLRRAADYRERPARPATAQTPPAEIARLRAELAAAYAELRKQRPVCTAYFDRAVWDRAMGMTS